MFRQATKDTINGWGQIFRFITPILITITLFILNDIKQELLNLTTHFTNHLSDHKNIELMIEKRLTHIETILRK